MKIRPETLEKIKAIATFIYDQPHRCVRVGELSELNGGQFSSYMISRAVSLGFLKCHYKTYVSIKISDLPDRVQTYYKENKRAMSCYYINEENIEINKMLRMERIKKHFLSDDNDTEN